MAQEDRDGRLPDVPGDYDLSELPLPTTVGAYLLDLLKLALPLAEEYDARKGLDALFSGYIRVMVEHLEAEHDAPKGRGE